MKRGENAKGHIRDETVLTIRLGLNKIKTKRHSIDRSSTYTTMPRLCGTKVVSIREKTSIAFRVWQGQMTVG